MDNNSFSKALSELEALKAKALAVQAEIDAGKKDSAALSESLAQQEAQNVTTYATQAAEAKISALKNADSHSATNAKKFIKDWADAFSQASDLAKKFSGALSDGIVADSGTEGFLGNILGTGSTGKMLNNILGGLFGGGFGGYFADGGRPDADKVSLVGERGPELFVPDTAGTVIPNDELGSGSSVVVYQNFTFQSLDPATNMKLLQAQKDQIRNWVADGIKTNANGLRSAVKSAS